MLMRFYRGFVQGFPLSTFLAILPMHMALQEAHVAHLDLRTASLVDDTHFGAPAEVFGPAFEPCASSTKSGAISSPIPASSRPLCPPAASRACLAFSSTRKVSRSWTSSVLALMSGRTRRHQMSGRSTSSPRSARHSGGRLPGSTAISRTSPSGPRRGSRSRWPSL